ncbi:MAG: hypothetical protein ABI288_00055, partial [Ginsengibacter sp.]
MHKSKIMLAKPFYNTIKSYFGFFKKILGIALILFSMINQVKAQKQKELDIITNHWLAYSDAPNSLYHYLTGEAYKMLDARSEKLKQIHTVDGWRKYQAKVRQTLWNIIGPFPQKTSLNAKTTGIVKKDGY